MVSTVVRLCILFLAFVLPTSGSSEPLLSLSLPSSNPVANFSQVSNISDSNNVPYCIDTTQQQLWAGRVYWADCQVALYNLNSDVIEELTWRRDRRVVSDTLTFYTTADGFRPSMFRKSRLWELPSSSAYASCVVQVRMTRDTIAMSTPSQLTPGSYINPQSYPQKAVTSWQKIFDEARQLLARCPGVGRPGLTFDIASRPSGWRQEGSPVVIYFWAKGSRIDWLYPRNRVALNESDSAEHPSNSSTAVQKR